QHLWIQAECCQVDPGLTQTRHRMRFAISRLATRQRADRRSRVELAIAVVSPVPIEEVPGHRLDVLRRGRHALADRVEPDAGFEAESGPGFIDEFAGADPEQSLCQSRFGYISTPLVAHPVGHRIDAGDLRPRLLHTTLV